MIPQVCSRIALGLAYRRSARPASQFVVSTIPSSSLDGVRFHSSKSPSSSMQKKALAVLRNHRKSDDSSTESEISTTETIAKGGPSSPIQTLNNDFNNEANTAAAATDVPSKAKNDTNTNTQKSETKIEATPSPDAKLAPPPQQELKPRLDSHFLHEFAPKIVVVGVGGAGGNALNNMVAKELKGVDFLALNTDAQHLSSMLTDQRLQLGIHLTNGLGCGANPDAGRMAAEESREQIQEQLKDAHLVFITAGMGGGTGTGAAPVVADICYEMGILTVGVVTLPFSFEGTHRRRLALEGVERLQSVVDTLIVIPNQNLFQIAGPETTFVDAFQMADDVLLGGVKSITDLMTSPGLINLDFADVQTVMVGMGNALLGTGVSNDETDRAIKAAQLALANPLLGDTLDITSAKGMLVNITGGKDMTLFEVDKAAQLITNSVKDQAANIIFGSAYDPTLEGSIRVSVVATGIDPPEL